MIRDAIVYETPGQSHYVRRTPEGHFEVYRNGATAAERVARIGDGPGPQLGLDRAKAEADRREAEPARNARTIVLTREVAR